jgi:hypothetical protein
MQRQLPSYDFRSGPRPALSTTAQSSRQTSRTKSPEPMASNVSLSTSGNPWHKHLDPRDEFEHSTENQWCHSDDASGSYGESDDELNPLIRKITLNSSRSFSTGVTQAQKDVSRDIKMSEQELEQTEQPANNGPAGTPMVEANGTSPSPVQASTSSSADTGQNQVSPHHFLQNTTLIHCVGCYHQPHSVTICDRQVDSTVRWSGYCLRDSQRSVFGPHGKSPGLGR